MASKPVVLTVDDDPQVLRAVERDLRRAYAAEYRVMRAESGAEALDLLARVRDRGDPVALLLADQRMPEMSGVEFLEQAMVLHPRAKRVLLTAYADTDAAIRAINAVRVHNYLMKPWDPPEENLFPYLGELLEDWQAGYRPRFEGIRVVGNRWSPETHAVRDFLGRNLIAFRWLDVESSDEARELLAAHAGAEAAPLPLVAFPDGVQLAAPTARELAERVGLRTQAKRRFYDLAVVGAGPAGLAAAVYGASEGLSTVLVEREAPGGQAGSSSKIENYLGFPTGLTGADLTRRGVAQARRFGAEIISPQDVTSLRVEDGFRVLTLADGGEISAGAVLVATGVAWTKLDVPGADALTGAGVYYGAAAAEAIQCRGEHVFVIGAGNSAGQGAMNFAQYADRVTMLVRGADLGATMSSYLVEQIAATPNIEVLVRTRVTAVFGDGRLETVTLLDARGCEQTVPATSLFVFIGAVPHTAWLGDLVARDARGFILTGPDLLVPDPAAPGGVRRPPGWRADRDPYLLETSTPGLFVAGDVRHQSIKRVASAVGEGAMAVSFVHQFLAAR
jgi:thioredoxin reductase (NADPH)